MRSKLLKIIFLLNRPLKSDSLVLEGSERSISLSSPASRLALACYQGGPGQVPPVRSFTIMVYWQVTKPKSINKDRLYYS